MRVSVPGIPQAILNSSTSTWPIKSLSEAASLLTEFLGLGNVALLTGAGVSVDSGIRAYRGDDGRYMNPNYKPLFYHELMDPTAKGNIFRLRSYLGYPPVRDALPNTTHYSIAALQEAGFIKRLITQNVDGLHHKALVTASPTRWTAPRIASNILELHGTLHVVHCNKGHKTDRETFQQWLSTANPSWRDYYEDLYRTGMQLRTNPDGDVAVEQHGISYNDFVVPDCPSCLSEGHQNSVQKPEVIFFGESIPKYIKDRSYQDVEECDRLLVKHALELNKPVMLLNLGPTRADSIPDIVKLDVPSGAIMQEVASSVIGSDARTDPVIMQMLRSGVVSPPRNDDDRTPRAAG
ncbi:DHS-like NAD/FAD-binding domain-containing protein [Panaeolus papilionaceus]|nr:DHS-like NAD/FAD-binding domain-containing protein [Panaeolus papilionaceus]